MGEQDESKIKKQFRERDVTRMRNIITKKFGEATVTQVGYSKKEAEHLEGDVWEENGKEWTIRDGIKQTNTKLDGFKKAILLPLLCPECSHTMKHKFDEKMHRLHGKCFDCVIVMETELRRTGKYQEYINNIVAGNISEFVKEAKDFIHEFSNELETSYYTEQGDKEEFVGTENKKKMTDEWIKELNQMEETLIKKQN